MIQQYYHMLGKDARALHYLAYHEKDWSKEENNAPCVFSLPPNMVTKYSKHFSTPFENVYFAGTEHSNSCWSGYMEGAVYSGEHSANQILSEFHQVFEVDHPGTFIKQFPRSNDFPARDLGPSFFEKYIVPSPYFFIFVSLVILGFGIYKLVVLFLEEF